MLKQTIEYTDFDDNQSVETVYFNLTKTELADNIHLKDTLEQIQRDIVDGTKRSLKTSEITQILELVKTFMKLSYGVRSADGKRFIKTPEQWTEFTQTAIYDAFLFSLFETPNKALNFMSGILPQDMRSEAKSAGDAEMLKMATAEKLTAQSENVGPTVVAPTPPVNIPMDVDSQPKKSDVVSSLPARKALEDMTPEEFAQWQADRAAKQQGE